MIHRPPF